jgi:WD40 repeat protein
VWSVAFSPDGQRLATASGDTARVWDAATGQELTKIIQHGARGVRTVAFSPDGQRLATISNGYNGARVWDAATGRELFGLSHININSVVFSPDSQRLATVANGSFTFPGGPNDDVYGKTVRVWNAATGQELFQLSHEGVVWSVAFSPDGQRLATADMDKTAWVWDAATGRELARINHESEVWSVAFSPDGQRLATASGDTVRVWLWRAEDLIAEACKRLPRNLTHQEWRQYVGEEVPYHATCPNLPVPED